MLLCLRSVREADMPYRSLIAVSLALVLTGCGTMEGTRTTTFSSDIFDAPTVMAGRAPVLLNRKCAGTQGYYAAETEVWSETTELGLQQRGATVRTTC